MADRASRPTPDAFSVPALMGRLMIRMRQRGDQVTREWGLSPQAGRTLGFIEASEAKGIVQKVYINARWIR